MLIYVETRDGNCCVREAKNIEEGTDVVLREVGTRIGIKLCREATKEDISYIRGMGGYVPENY